MVMKISQDMNVGSRENQEDAIAISSKEVFATHGFMAVLSDGMGGLLDGEKFSEIATREMIQCFEKGIPQEDMYSELLRCYANAQKAALAIQPENEDDRGGATVTAILVRGGRFVFLSVGDSRIYLLRGGGLIPLNREQTLGVRLDERAALGDLMWNQVKSNDRRKALIAHLGRESGIEPDMCSHPQRIVPGDRIILMSDGVFGTLTDNELLPLLSQDMPTCAESVIREVLNKKKAGQDNCSILIFALEQE